MAAELFLDIETAEDRLLCTGWAFGSAPVRVSFGGPDVDAIRSVLEDPEQVVVTHSTYDLRHFRLNEGWIVRAELHDTKALAWLINENTSLDLESLCRLYLSKPLDKRLSANGKSFRTDEGIIVPFGSAPQEQVARYCSGDVAATRELYWLLRRRVASEGLEEHYEQVVVPFTNCLLDMECRGLPIDIDAAAVLRDEFIQKRDQAELALKQNLPEAFNIRSNPQVHAFLTQDRVRVNARRQHGLEGDALKTAKLLLLLAGPRDPDTAEVGSFVTERFGRLYEEGYWIVPGLDLVAPERLEGVAISDLRLNRSLADNDWVLRLLEFRKYDKLLSTYIEKFPRIARDGRVYGRFNQTGTATGRLSSSEPNLQNIPSRGELGDQVRDLFRGNLVVGDFGQLEPRLMAHFSQDPELLDIFKDGRDLYSEVGETVGCTRRVAKVLVLALSYGAGPDKVAEILALSGIPIPVSEVRTFLHLLQEKFTVYFLWRENVIAVANREGCVRTLDGRLRRLPQNPRAWKQRGIQAHKARTGRQAANAVIQGSAADIVTRVMIHMDSLFSKLKMLAQVHDEIVWEYNPEDPPDLDSVETWTLRLAQRGLSVPLVFEPHFGHSWLSAKEGTDDAPVLPVGVRP